MKEMRRYVMNFLARITEEIEKRLDEKRSFTIGYTEFRDEFISIWCQFWEERVFSEGSNISVSQTIIHKDKFEDELEKLEASILVRIEEANRK